MPKSKYSTGLENQRFGRWVVVSFSHSRGKVAEGLEYIWNCRCDCGTERPVNARLLFRGKSTSCGCYNREVTSKKSTKHGLLIGVNRAGQPRGKTASEYRSWDHMIQRCTNPNVGQKTWRRYGGRGIAVCARFRDFISFLNLVGNKPTPFHSIDRINNDGNYSCGQCDDCQSHGWPMNVRWATSKQQASNQTHRNRRAA